MDVVALRKLQPWIPAAAVAVIAAVVAWIFAATALHFNAEMGLPLDDSYIYLTYAKQIGRGEPFTYYPGGGYSAGATSVLWPALLAPFWTLGLRGHALVWVAYVVCAVLYALTALGVWQVVRGIAGTVAGGCAAIVVLAMPAFAWTALSGMEVALASACLVGMILLLIDQPSTGGPRKRLVAVLAAASLSRPEALLLVVGIIAVAVIARVRQRDLRASARWLAPLAAPVAWLAVNRVLAGHWFPNTGVSKSYFYQPGFDLDFYVETVVRTFGKALKGLALDDTSPFTWAPVFFATWLVGAIRTLRWARAAGRPLAGAVIVVGPFVILAAIAATSGAWNFQNYRYLAPILPVFAIGFGAALAPFGWFETPWRIATAVVVAAYVAASTPGLRADARLYAQGVMDTNTQVVRIGQFVRDRLPGASLMIHDAGAIAYYSDAPVFDMVGLVSNHHARVSNHGPGARFEFLETIPAHERPSHFAYYRSWLVGTDDFYGHTLLATPLRAGLDARRFAGDVDMQLVEANFDRVGTGELPLIERAGWRVVDRIDVADLASEAAHDWHGALGRRRHGERTARWSFVARDGAHRGLVLDGGRTIREGRERFTLDIDATRPARLVMRTGGPSYAFAQPPVPQAVELRIIADGTDVGALTLPVPSGPFVELAILLPAGVRTVEARARSPYRVFHWFVLQPE